MVHVFGNNKFEQFELKRNKFKLTAGKTKAITTHCFSIKQTKKTNQIHLEGQGSQLEGTHSI
jgi:hypothetical protein